MKKIMMILYLSMSMSCIVGMPSLYLWESQSKGERSCCFHMGGVDVCNPYTPCTRFIQKDLQGIGEYLFRIMATEGGQSLSSSSALRRMQGYINSVVQGLLKPQLSYIFETNRSVRFLHDIIDIEKKNKQNKQNAISGMGGAGSQKAQQEAINQYLSSLGLVRPVTQQYANNIKQNVIKERPLSKK